MDMCLEFNRVTYGIPVEKFRIEAYIALEERLPVVTEYALRLIRICERVPLHSLRDYFGFSDAEALSIVEALSRQGLLEVEDDEVRLTQFANEKFDSSGDDHPRFSKVELKKDVVDFDLLTFSLLNPGFSSLFSDNIIKLEASDDAVGYSIERAREAYHRSYPEIASRREDLREKSYGVYSIETIESKKRSYAPLPVRFLIDEQGDVQRSFDEAFERNAPIELLNEVTEQVTASIPTGKPLKSHDLEEFIRTFNLQVLGRYLIGDSFDLSTYLDEVHISKKANYPKGVVPVFGNLYLQSNRDRILARLKSARQNSPNKGIVSTSLAWFVPDYPLWGRGEALAETVSMLREVLLDGEPTNDLYLCTYAEQGQEADITNKFRIKGLKELHFSRPNTINKKLMGGHLEIFLYPTSFVCSMYHLPISGNTGLWAPLGFISTQPKHLEVAHKLLRKTLEGISYAGKAQFKRPDRTEQQKFEQAFPFLNYESLI